MYEFNLELPQDFIFTAELQIGMEHINYGGHAGHDRLITLLQEARMRFFQSCNFQEVAPNGDTTIITDLSVSYKKEAFWNERVLVNIAPVRHKPALMDLFYQVLGADHQQEILRCITRILYYNTRERKKAVLPAQLFQKN